jgi:hypothetical protein
VALGDDEDQVEEQFEGTTVARSARSTGSLSGTASPSERRIRRR